jgi:hypothetical protein
VFDEMAQAGGVSVTAHDLFSPWRHIERSGDGYLTMPA